MKTHGLIDATKHMTIGNNVYLWGHHYVFTNDDIIRNDTVLTNATVVSYFNISSIAKISMTVYRGNLTAILKDSAATEDPYLIS